MSTVAITVEQGIQTAGVGRFQYRLFVIFGLVWMADAMQVLSIGFSAPSIAQTFGIAMPRALETGTFFFIGMLVGAFAFGRLADRIGRRPVLMAAVIIDACFGVASAFSPDFTWLLALRLLTGIGVGGTLPVDYTMMAEFLPSDRRGRWLVLLESVWAVGCWRCWRWRPCAGALTPGA
jgi:putative MFS transporter